MSPEKFVKNLEYFYEVTKAKEGYNLEQFSALFGISRSEYYRKFSYLDEKKFSQISFTLVMRIVEEFNKTTGLKIKLTDFFNIDLKEKYPLKKLFNIEEGQGNLYKTLRENRKISLRGVERLSRKLFKDKAYHMTATYVLRLERGDFKSPSIKKLMALSKIYRIPIELLIGTTSMSGKSTIEKYGNYIVVDMKKIKDANKVFEDLKKVLNV